jgi:hypothetical protein
MWTAILTQILAAALPFLEKALHDWLASRLASVAGEQPAQPSELFGAAGDETAKHAALFLLSKVRDSLYWFQFAKKAAVDASISAVNK